MRKVIKGSLNGNAYQFEEQAFHAVQAYLAHAAARFATNPDRAEILADLEQAIADKCDTFLGRHKTVVSLEEARQALREMGPVDGNAPDCDESVPCASHAAAVAVPRRRRLYRLTSEGMLGGVCAGLAAYLNVDVVWVRLAYVLLTISSGIWFFVWLVQLCITPQASTAGEVEMEGLNDARQNLRDAFGR